MKAAKPIVFRTANDGMNDELSHSGGTDFSESPSLTVQSAKGEADINEIVRRFGLLGEMPAARNVPEYGDFSEIGDYQSALDNLIKLDESFAQLPADTRARFNNDPGQLYGFLHDESNRDEAVKLGLIVAPEPVPGPIKVEVVSPPPEAP